MKYANSFAIVCLLFFGFRSSAETTENIKYLSDELKGYAFVENLQKHYCEQQNASHDCKIDERFCVSNYTSLWRKMFNEDPPKDDIGERCNRVSTRHEMPGAYKLLQDIYDEVVSVSPKFGAKVLSNTSLGTLPIKRINAFVFPPDASYGNILIFNQRFFEFASELAKIAAMSVPVSETDSYVTFDISEEGSVELFAADKELQFLLVNRIVHFLELEKLKPYPPPEHIQSILVRYQHGIELWAMAHEYAHIAFEHHTQKQSLDIQGVDKNIISVSGGKASWVNEFSADFFATNVLSEVALLRLTNKNAHPADYLIRETASFYFTARQIVDEAKHIFLGEDYKGEVPKSEWDLFELASNCLSTQSCNLALKMKNQELIPTRHPHHKVRKALIESIMESTNNGDNETAKSMRTLALTMEKNILTYWRLIKTQLSTPDGKKIIENIMREQK